MTFRNEYALPLDGTVGARAITVALSMTLRGFVSAEATSEGYEIRAAGADGGVRLRLQVPASGRGQIQATHLIEPNADGIPPAYRGDPRRLARDLQFATASALDQTRPLAATLQAKGGVTLKLEDQVEIAASPREMLRMLQDAFDDLHAGGGNVFLATLNERGLSTRLSFTIVGHDPIGPTRLSIEMLRAVPLDDHRALRIRAEQRVVRADRDRIVELLHGVAAGLRAAAVAAPATAQATVPAAAHQPPPPRRRAIARERWRGFSLG